MGVSVTTDRTRYDVTPGTTFTVSVTVTNNGSRVEQFQITMRGLPGAQVRVEPPVLNLEGGRHGEALVRVSVPDDAPIRAGRQVAGVHVWGKNDRNAQRLREFEIVVTPNPALALGVTKRGRRNGRYQHAAVAVTNAGNVPLRLRVDGHDPQNLVDVDMDGDGLEVDPFTTETIDALLRGPLRVVGSPTNHTISFRAVGMQLEQSFDYPMTQRAWLGKSMRPWMVVVGVLVLAFLMWPRYAVLDDYVGRQLTETETALSDAGVTYEVTSREGTEPAETIVAQDPPSGTEIRLGNPLGLFTETVELTASSGPPTLEVPAGLVDQLRAVADDTLGELRTFGVVIEYVSAPSDEIAEQRVIRTEPPSGEILVSGDVLTIVVSTGPAPFDAPSFVGMDIGEMNVAAEQAGLNIDRLERELEDETQDGLVVDQNPRAGEPVRPGSTVTVWIGVYTEPTTTTTATTTTVAGDG